MAEGDLPKGSPAVPVLQSAAAPDARAALVRQLYLWHWLCAAVCVPAMLLFAVTGITLNHAGDIGAQHEVRHVEVRLPAVLVRGLAAEQGARAALPAEVVQWLASELGVARSALRTVEAEWSLEEIYLGMPRPGGDAWLRIDRQSGTVEFEDSDRGWIAYFNDLHKGRNTGSAWRWFLDVFSLACIVFTLTGLAILALHAARRPLTWPVTGLGLLVPLLLMMLFIH